MPPLEAPLIGIDRHRLATDGDGIIFDFQSKKRQLYKEIHASEIHVKIRTW